MNVIFPNKLFTPVIPLGISIQDGLQILNTLAETQVEKDGEEISYRVNTPDFDVAIYEGGGVVKSVWFNDPIGRVWNYGKNRKINLYLERYGKKADWELRMKNGWMKYYFNEESNAAMVYGIHNDVIRFNIWHSA